VKAICYVCGWGGCFNKMAKHLTAHHNNYYGGCYNSYNLRAVEVAENVQSDDEDEEEVSGDDKDEEEASGEDKEEKSDSESNGDDEEEVAEEGGKGKGDTKHDEDEEDNKKPAAVAEKGKVVSVGGEEKNAVGTAVKASKSKGEKVAAEAVAISPRRSTRLAEAKSNRN
jgi:hypothetical protein